MTFQASSMKGYVMKRPWILLATDCYGVHVTAQTVPQKNTFKADSASASVKPVTTLAGEPLSDTVSGHQQQERK
jgi:hypothetical protein